MLEHACVKETHRAGGVAGPATSVADATLRHAKEMKEEIAAHRDLTVRHTLPLLLNGYLPKHAISHPRRDS